PAFAEYKENGATVIKVDYSTEGELKKAFSGVEVVVSALGQFALGVQVEVAKVAKAAGVQLFVPAEYGIYVTEGFTSHKKVVQDTLKELQLPYTVFYTGFFARDHGFLGFDYANARIRVVGSGDVPFSVTARPDIARFVAHTLTTAEPTDLAWAKIPIEGDRKTHHEVAAIAEKKFGKKFEIEYVDLEENRKKFNTDFIAFFTTILADGNAVSGPAEAVEAAIQKFFPEWNPSPIDEFIVA
uniref:NmrA-like domain-containing protein n=1 Tax=Globisporangium ultimum (strain ATCC 200006 / CBS 805.95 / DAOM BR144) TaxID=431595 RepID=K3WWE9_GLOUD